MEELLKYKVNEEPYNYVLSTPPYGKFYINDKNIVKNIIKKCVDNHVNIGLCEIFDEELNQLLLFDIDIYLQSIKTNYEITIDDIKDFIKVCNSLIHKYLDISIDEINAFVLTKHNFENNKEWKNGKEYFGIHIYYPKIFLNLEEKKLLYHSIIEECTKKNVFSKLPLLHNSYNNIIDECFYRKNPVMLYGSSKLNNTYYKLQYIIKYNLNIEKNKEYSFDELFDILSFNQNKKNITMKNTISIIPENLKYLSDNSKKKYIRKKKTNINLNLIKKLVLMLSKERAIEYNRWIEVGLCLHNIDDSEENLEIYKEFSNIDDIKYTKTNFTKLWKQFKKKNDGLNMGTLKYWASKDSPQEFKNYQMNEIDKKLTITIEEDGNTSYDIAKVLYELYNDTYKCSSIKKDTWYEFKNHLWRKMEAANKLYLNISEELVFFYKNKVKSIRKDLLELEDDEEQDALFKKGLLKQKKDNINKIIKKLKDCKFKKNLIDECKHLFYDETFYEKLDELNRHLIGFNNGIYDLNKLSFRDGNPNDYISFSTGIDYVDYNKNDPNIIKVFNIFNEMHENEDKTNYFLTTIAMGLHGLKATQRIDFWTGTGSNGKSLTVDFLQKALGDYFYSPSITILTIKRKSSSNASPDLMKIKGRRILVFQEPEHDDKICTGLMKSLFGNDMICGRNLHENECSFKPQASGFLACNDLPNIPSNDGGTWRRIKVLHFPYKFTTKDILEENEKRADLSLYDEINNLKEYFMSLLIHYFKINKLYNNSKINEPDYVKQFTEKYKNQCDIYADFITCFITKTNEADVKLEYKNLYSNFMSWARENHEGPNGPKRSEIKKKFEQKFGNLIKGRYWEKLLMKKYVKMEDNK